MNKNELQTQLNACKKQTDSVVLQLDYLIEKIENNSDILKKADTNIEVLAKLYNILLANELLVEENRNTIKLLANNLINKKLADTINKHYGNNGIFNSVITSKYAYFRLPTLTPKSYIYTDKNSKAEQICDFSMQKYISDSLVSYQEKNGFMDLWEEFTVIFIHHYVENDKILSPDTLDIKKPIDGLLTSLVKNDGLNSTHIMQLSKKDASNFTEMYVIKGHGLSDAVLKTLNRINEIK